MTDIWSVTQRPLILISFAVLAASSQATQSGKPYGPERNRKTLVQQLHLAGQSELPGGGGNLALLLRFVLEHRQGALQRLSGRLVLAEHLA